MGLRRGTLRGKVAVMQTVEPAKISEQLRRIVESPGFSGAPRMQRFLTFIVESAQAGETEALKESVLGREVFDRGADFDPRTDPIVRVEARRLRTRLEEYYAGPGAAETLRIEIPKGGYVPSFSAGSRRRQWSALPWLVAATLLLVAGVAWWLIRQPPAGATLAVVPAHWVWKNGENLDPARELEIAERLTAELVQAPALRVLGWPLVSQRRGSELQAFGEYVLLIAVRPSAKGRRLTCYLLQSGGGSKKWVWDEEFTEGDERRVAKELRERAGLVMRK